jgi:hypothetical protein
MKKVNGWFISGCIYIILFFLSFAADIGKTSEPTTSTWGGAILGTLLVAFPFVIGYLAGKTSNKTNPQGSPLLTTPFGNNTNNDPK